MTPIECLKILKNKIDTAGLNKSNYAIETSDIELINETLDVDAASTLSTRLDDCDCSIYYIDSDFEIKNKKEFNSTFAIGLWDDLLGAPIQKVWKIIQ